MSQGRQSTTAGARRPQRADAARPATDAARKRAAVEIVARHEAALKRTARRYSLDAEDAEDAYQRALEIVLTKAPTTDLRELIRWTQTVTKHEALALRENRARLLGHRGPAAREGSDVDPVALIPASGDGPDELAERRELVSRSREALRTLKPAELRALTLLAEGYSYAEIGEMAGFSQTKVNRVLAEGRDRFRKLLSSSEDGSRCRELRPLLSAFCDGEASHEEAITVREHLRACMHCRATMRDYRAAPRIAIALMPALAVSRSPLERMHDLFVGLGSRLPGIGAGDSTTQVAAAGGMRGAGAITLAKLLTICAGAAGVTTACVVTTGAVQTPLDLTPDRQRAPAIVRSVETPDEPPSEASQFEPVSSPPEEPAPQPQPVAEKPPEPEVEASTEVVGAAEYEAPPVPPAPAPSSSGDGSSSSASSGSAAGEFGP
jgi:RNA polymerase sigma factor (sigma-70 family)